MTYSAHREGSNFPWNPNIPPSPGFTEQGGFVSEGTFFLLQRLKQEKIIDDFIVVMDSARGHGVTTYEGVKVYVVPEISQIDPYLKKDDVIWVRGGFRSWFNWIVRKKEQGHWVMLYAANTGRQRWTFWHVVLDDLHDSNRHDRHGRVFLKYRKPTNTSIFHPLDIDQVYDVCAGASYVHDKKGQWRVIESLIEYQRIYGKNLYCVLPGAFRHSTHSSQIRDKINTYHLDVKITGMLPRKQLAVVLNQSRLFVHLGSSGQNDRGPLEALHCGCPIVIGSPSYHSPMVYNNESISFVPPDKNDFTAVAKDLHRLVKRHNKKLRSEVIAHCRKEADLDSVIVPAFRRLFKVYKENPTPNTDALREEYGV